MSSPRRPSATQSVSGTKATAPERFAPALDACGLTWAVPHTFRRTVATLLDQANLPIARIADQLGHSDVSMTARVYLGRDLKGDKRDLARIL